MSFHFTPSSLDPAKAISYIGHDDDERTWSEFDQYHRDALKRLEASDADSALIVSNSAHHRFDAIVQGLRMPVISIIDAMARKSVDIGGAPSASARHAYDNEIAPSS